MGRPAISRVAPGPMRRGLRNEAHFEVHATNALPYHIESESGG